jgi:hypothetical protein
LHVVAGDRGRASESMKVQKAATFIVIRSWLNDRRASHIILYSPVELEGTEDLNLNHLACPCLTSFHQIRGPYGRQMALILYAQTRVVSRSAMKLVRLAPSSCVLLISLLATHIHILAITRRRYCYRHYTTPTSRQPWTPSFHPRRSKASLTPTILHGAGTA